MIEEEAIVISQNGKFAEVDVAVYAGPLNDTITTRKTILVSYTSTSLTDVSNEFGFLFDVAKDGCNSILVCDIY